jgi:hypothetical protein
VVSNGVWQAIIDYLGMLVLVGLGNQHRRAIHEKYSCSSQVLLIGGGEVKPHACR